jgi:predicted TPR repeat methyltransferase
MDPDTFERAKTAFLEGVAHVEAGRLPEAERAFDASLAWCPGRPSTLTNLAGVRLGLGRPAQALEALDQSLAIDAEQADAWCQHGIALLHLQRPGDALASFEQALQVDPHLLAAWYHLGCTCNLLHRHRQALTAFDRLLAADAQRGEVWFRHGQTLQALERHADALASYERALALDPTLAQAWINRAGIFKDSGRLAEAATDYRKALEHGGDRELIGFYLAALEGREAPAAAPRDYVQGLFDDYAERFDHHLVQVLGYRGHEVLVQQLEQAAPGRRFRHALDLGCGTGLCGIQLCRLAECIDGVDLSAHMLAQAARLQVYARLERGDVAEYLAATDRRYDLIAAADVFTYIGDLDAVFAAAARVLQAGGLFCFSVEVADDAVDFVLRGSLRYAHSRRYVEALAQRHGYAIVHLVRKPMREDQRQPIDALYGVLSR